MKSYELVHVMTNVILNRNNWTLSTSRPRDTKQPPKPTRSDATTVFVHTHIEGTSSGGGLGGGSGPKTRWGMRLLDKIMILQGIKRTIQPLGVGYANRPKKAQNGGYVAFSPIACLALI